MTKRWLKHPIQQELQFHRRGGKRKGAGRKRGNRVSHDARPRFKGPQPAHVTLKVRPGTRSLRSQHGWESISECLDAAKDRLGMRLIEFSVLGDHVHFVVEADGNEALSRAMIGIQVRLARSLNRVMARQGPLFADHYYSRLIHTPTDLVRTIRYVLDNHRHHFGTSGDDFFSSAVHRGLLARAVGWLLRVGWRRARVASLLSVPPGAS